LRDHWQQVICLPLTEVDEGAVGVCTSSSGKRGSGVCELQNYRSAVRPEGEIVYLQNRKSIEFAFHYFAKLPNCHFGNLARIRNEHNVWGLFLCLNLGE
jgi:hypothetical protein